MQLNSKTLNSPPRTSKMFGMRWSLAEPRCVWVEGGKRALSEFELRMRDRESSEEMSE